MSLSNTLSAMLIYYNSSHISCSASQDMHLTAGFDLPCLIMYKNKTLLYYHNHFHNTYENVRALTKGLQEAAVLQGILSDRH